MTDTAFVATEQASRSPIPRRLWQVAGGLGIAHLVLIFAGIGLSTSAMFEEGRAGVATYAASGMTRTVAGGFVELLGFVLLIPVLVFLARALGRSPAGRWAAQSALVAGGAYVALTFSPGLAAGATAMHAAHSGVGVDTAWVMNNLRIITYVVSLMLLGAHAIGVGIAALGDRFSPRLVGAGGLVTGAVLLTSPLLLSAGLQDIPTLIWSLWWVGLSVQLLRRKGR
jgi:hypothetical protein